MQILLLWQPLEFAVDTRNHVGNLQSAAYGEQWAFYVETILACGLSGLPIALAALPVRKHVT